MKTSALFLKQHEVHVIAQKIAESSYVLSIQLQENVCVCVCFKENKKNKVTWLQWEAQSNSAKLLGES